MIRFKCNISYDTEICYLSSQKMLNSNFSQGMVFPELPEPYFQVFELIGHHL